MHLACLPKAGKVQINKSPAATDDSAASADMVKLSIAVVSAALLDKAYVQVCTAVIAVSVEKSSPKSNLIISL